MFKNKIYSQYILVRTYFIYLITFLLFLFLKILNYGYILNYRNPFYPYHIPPIKDILKSKNINTFKIDLVIKYSFST